MPRSPSTLPAGSAPGQSLFNKNPSLKIEARDRSGFRVLGLSGFRVLGLGVRAGVRLLGFEWGLGRGC